jgi:hypothetical protein
LTNRARHASMKVRWDFAEAGCNRRPSQCGRKEISPMYPLKKPHLLLGVFEVD